MRVARAAACIIFNGIWSALACGLFYKAMPDWDKMATETPAPVMGTSAAVPAAAVEITETVGPKV